MASTMARFNLPLSPGLARSTRFKSTECSLPKHNNNRPSTVNRTRLQAWQKLWLWGEIKPIRLSLPATR